MNQYILYLKPIISEFMLEEKDQMVIEGNIHLEESLYSNLSASSKQTLLAWILKNWEQLDPQTLKKKHLIFFCTKTWPQYNLSDGERCPPEGTLNYNTILLLSLSCKWEGKRSEIPYVQAFFALREDPTLCKNCEFSQSVPPVVSSSTLTSIPQEIWTCQ